MGRSGLPRRLACRVNRLQAMDVVNSDAETEETALDFKVAREFDQIGDEREGSAVEGGAGGVGEEVVRERAVGVAGDEHRGNAPGDAERGAFLVGLAFAWFHGAQ